MNNPRFCPLCGGHLVDIKLDEGEFPSCFDCKVRYTIHGTGVGGSLFVIGADVLIIHFDPVERACTEFVMVNGVKVVCGEPESKHTPEAARTDVGMDHNFVPATWDAERNK